VLLAEATRGALTDLAGILAVANVTSDDLLARLHTTTSAVPKMALAARKDPRIHPALLDDIADGSPGNDERLMAALPAIALLHDETLIEPLVTRVQNSNVRVRKATIDVVRALSAGDDASLGADRKRARGLGRAWLFTLSTGHPDASIQQRAGAALASLERATEPTARAN
jgi:hypothetical protein